MGTGRSGRRVRNRKAKRPEVIRISVCWRRLCLEQDERHAQLLFIIIIIILLQPPVIPLSLLLLGTEACGLRVRITVAPNTLNKFLQIHALPVCFVIVRGLIVAIAGRRQ
jgi:hypothetical protein